MRFRLEIVPLLSFSILLATQSIIASDQETRISDADEEWTASISQIDQGATDSSGATVKLPSEAIVCHADEVWNYALETPPQDAIDSSNAAIKLPKEAVVCHADEVWTSELTKSDIDSEPITVGKNPVLFVPGILGTEIKSSNELIWIDPEKLFWSKPDDFLDALIFQNDLISSGELLLNGVITKKVIPFFKDYNYTEGLLNEFNNKGYITANGADGQNFFTFPYDWRYGVSGVYPKVPNTSAEDKTNVTLLRDKINEIAKGSPTGKVDVIAHSMGGLVVKKYIIENDNPKINKLVFLGVPNLGSPDAAQALLSGTDFKIPGLNTEEVRKIIYNMPAAYDLLPWKPYYDLNGSYLGMISQVGDTNRLDYRLLDYNAIQIYLKSSLNNRALNASAILHTSNNFDTYDVRTKVPSVYNIVGCKSGTLPYAAGNGAKLSVKPAKIISGDDTVPFESADSIIADNSKTFYMPLANHGQMPSQEGVKQMIISIVAGGEVPAQIIPYAVLKGNPALCQVKGDVIEIHSPLDIFVTEIDSGKNLNLGLDQYGNIIREIPGASFDIIGEQKYVYLPTGEGEQYSIALKGTDTGTFTLVDQKIAGDEVKSAEVFNDVPVTPEFGATLAIDVASAQIRPENGAAINPTSEIGAGASEDIIPPYATTTISGSMGKIGFYRSDVAVNLSAQDIAQEGAAASGVFSISYNLDGVTTTIETASTTINVATEGKHSLAFSSSDKLGNKEEPQTINFVIDKTAPEIGFKFDQTKKDLVFSAADNYSATSTINIVDQNGAVTATDEAGNTTQLTFTEKNRVQSLRAQLSGLSYNGKAVDMSGNQLMLAWFYGYTPQMLLPFPNWQTLPKLPTSLPNSGSLAYLLQQAKFKDGSLIVAIYSGGATKIYQYKDKKFTTQTLSGLKLVNFATEAGKLKWAF